MSTNVLEFVNESIALDKENKFLKGYSSEIDPTIYPDFYIDYVNRSNIKEDSAEINNYLNSSEDIFSEQYFSTLIYFANRASDEIADNILKHKEKYTLLYGETDVNILIYSFAGGKFDRAIAQNDQSKYAEAIEFVKTGLRKEWADDVISSHEKEFLMAQNKWDQVFTINQVLKDQGELSNGYINHFSWQVYKKCDDQKVIKDCLEWMKEVTTQEPEFDYLDTYAYLLYKSGDKQNAKRIAQLAIEAGKREDRKTTGLQKLVDRL